MVRCPFRARAGIAVVGLVVLAGTLHSRGPATFVIDFPIAGDYLISLPGTVHSPPMLKAEDLLAATNATMVAKFDPRVGNPLSPQFGSASHVWDGATCSGAGIEPAAASTCGSQCFCVLTDEGEGFFVRLTAPGRLTITGSDSPLVIDLQPPTTGVSATGTSQISMPFNTPIGTASELRDEIVALTASTVASVTRWDPFAMPPRFATYAGLHAANDFLIVPGEGYRILIEGNAVLYTPPALPTLSLQFPVAGSYIVSLPANVTAPPIGRAEELFDAIPHAIDVGKWDPFSDQLHLWDGVACGGAGPEPGSALCGSACFCIDTTEGEGFSVTVGAPSLLNLTGTDGPLNIAFLPPPLSGTNQISVPFDTPLVSASALAASIDATVAVPVVLAVSRRDPVLGVLQTYNGHPATDFLLQSGEGYRVQVLGTVTGYTPPFDPTVGGTAGTYLIEGGPTTTEFAWRLLDVGGQQVCEDLLAPLSGSTAADVAASFVASMSLHCPPVDVSVSRFGNLLTVTILAGSAFSGPPALIVGDAGNPNCAVGVVGCSFNPKIREVQPCGDAGAPVCDGTCPDAFACIDHAGIGCACASCSVTVPPAVDGLHFTSAEDLVWQVAACARAYNVYRHTAAMLADGDGDGQADDLGECLVARIEPPALNVGDVPRTGEVHFYLVTATSDLGESSLGYNSAGNERPNRVPC